MIFRHLHLKRIAIILLITLAIIVVFIGIQVSVLKFYPNKRIEHLERTHNEILSRLGSIEEYQRNPFAPAIDRAKQAIVHIIAYNTNERVIGQGSGVLIDKNKGYILTNYHVIENKNVEQIKAIFPNTDYRYDIAMGSPTSIVGYDRLSDLALLKSLISIKERHKINEIEWGNSKNLQVGEHAIAIGYPYSPIAQANPTITTGTISATSRNFLNQDFLKEKALHVEMIQTDALINKGNSGGALVNIHGQLIGINTIVRAQRIYLRTQEKDTSDTSFIEIPVAGMGFAIPAHNVRKVAEQLIENGCVIPPDLGIHTHPVTSNLREKTGILYGRGGYSTYSLPKGSADDRIPNYSGVYVADIDIGSPADNAGLKHGDLIGYWGKLEEKLIEYKEKDTKIIFFSGEPPIINEKHFKTLTRLLPINQDFYLFVSRPLINPTPKSKVSGTPYIKAMWLPAQGIKLQPKVLQWNYTPPGWRITFKQPNREESEKYKHRGIIATNILPDSPLATNLKSGDLIYKIIKKKEKEEITVANDQENEIHSLEEFTIRISNLTPSEDFWFHFERDGKNKATLITIPTVSLKKVIASEEKWKKAIDFNNWFNSLEPKSEEKRKKITDWTDWEDLFNFLEPKSVNPLKSE